jgi:hypothetical protein
LSDLPLFGRTEDTAKTLARVGQWKHQSEAGPFDGALDPSADSCVSKFHRRQCRNGHWKLQPRPCSKDCSQLFSASDLSGDFANYNVMTQRAQALKILEIAFSFARHPLVVT